MSYFYVVLFKPPYPATVEWDYLVYSERQYDRDCLPPETVRVLKVQADTRREAVTKAMAGRDSRAIIGGETVARAMRAAFGGE